MSDTYQAIYDGVRSRISNGDIGSAVAEAARFAFDISFDKEIVKSAFCEAADAARLAAYEAKRPSVLYRPTLSADGTMWCALLGDDLQIGVAGFGETPEAAMTAFDIAFLNERTPAAIRENRGQP